MAVISIFLKIAQIPISKTPKTADTIICLDTRLKHFFLSLQQKLITNVFPLTILTDAHSPYINGKLNEDGD